MGRNEILIIRGVDQSELLRKRGGLVLRLLPDGTVTVEDVESTRPRRRPIAEHEPPRVA